MLFSFSKSNTPKFVNGCSHKKSEYLGSVSYQEIDNVKKTVKECWLDIYIFNKKHQEVCIRYGNEASEYYSPGPLKNFILSVYNNDIYKLALEVIQEKGKIIFVKNKKFQKNNFY